MESNRDYVREVLMLGPIYQCFSLLTVNVSLVIICLSLYVKGTSICMCLLIFVGDSYIPPESALHNKPPCTFFLSLSGLRADAGDENNPGWVRVQSDMECPYRAPRSLLAKLELEWARSGAARAWAHPRSQTRYARAWLRWILFAPVNHDEPCPKLGLSLRSTFLRSLIGTLEIRKPECSVASPPGEFNIWNDFNRGGTHWGKEFEKLIGSRWAQLVSRFSRLVTN